MAARETRTPGWKHRQHRRANEGVLEKWYLDGDCSGIGFVCGEISGGLLLMEFEGRAVEDGTFDAFLDLADDDGLGDLIDDIRDGYEDESPSGGLHWLVRCEDPRTECLAWTWLEGRDGTKGRWAPLIETKGEGGYAISAPTSGSVHPSGKPWVRLRGGVDSVVSLTTDEWDSVCSLARQLDEKPPIEAKPPKVRTATKAGGRPGDDFNLRSEWSMILEPHGWEYLFTAADGHEHWSRPGKDPKATSATITADGQLLYVFSTATALEAQKSYSKFAAHAVLNHSGENGEVDWSSAASEIAGSGVTQRQPARGEVVTVCMADVKPTHVEFLWEARIPRGKVTLIAGDPGRGKTAVSFDLAARLSAGKKMPMTGMRHEPASAIIMTAEDGLDDTVAPRLIAAGADLNRIHAIVARKTADDFEAPLSFPEDIDVLKEEVIRTGASLVIIDPLNAFLTGKADAHRDHHVRRALHPLTMMAEETGVSILIVHHLNKSASGSALYRVGGSIGVTAAARSTLLVSTDPTDPDLRVLAVLKSNLAAFPQSVEFRLVDDPENGTVRVQWEGLSDLTAEDLLDPKSGDRSGGARSEATTFLEDALQEGPLPAEEVKRQAIAIGISETTLQRAKRDLAVVSGKVGFGRNGAWQWSLPSGKSDEPKREDR